MKMFRVLAMVAFAAAATFTAATPRAFAQPGEETLETARGMGMGTGGRAGAVSTSALAYNPAGLARGQLYHVEGIAAYNPTTGTLSLGSAIVDSFSSKLAMGMSVRGLLDMNDEGVSGIDGRVAAAMAVSDAIAIGASARYVNIQPGQESVIDPDDEACGLSLDASISVSPLQGLTIVALGHNLLSLGTPLAPLLLGGGAGYALGPVSLAFDWLVDMSTFEEAEYLIGGGAEYLIASSIPIRAGYRYDSGRNLHSVSGSIGYVDRGFGLDLAVRQDVSGGNDTRVVVGIRYHVQ